MLIVELVFPDQYQAGLTFTQNVTSNTMASKYISEADLPRQNMTLLFLMLLRSDLERRFFPVVLCEISSEKSIWHLSQCELLSSRRYWTV